MILLSCALLLEKLFILKLLQLVVVILVLLRLDRLLPIRLVGSDVLRLQMNSIKINAAMFLQMLVAFVKRFL